MTSAEVATVSRAPSPTAKAVALAIMDMHGDDGTLSYMEIGDLAAYLEVSERTIERALHDLIGGRIVTNLDPDPTDSAALFFVCGDRANSLRLPSRAA